MQWGWPVFDSVDDSVGGRLSFSYILICYNVCSDKEIGVGDSPSDFNQSKSGCLNIILNLYLSTIYVLRFLIDKPVRSFFFYQTKYSNWNKKCVQSANMDCIQGNPNLLNEANDKYSWFPLSNNVDNQSISLHLSR